MYKSRLTDFRLNSTAAKYIREGKYNNLIRLKELREERRLNQEGLAMILNVSQSTISAYEIGERSPDVVTLIAIANFFDVSLDYLMGLSDSKQKIMQSDLASDELEHLHTFRRLSDSDKEKVKAYIDGLLSRS